MYMVSHGSALLTGFFFGCVCTAGLFLWKKKRIVGVHGPEKRSISGRQDGVGSEIQEKRKSEASEQTETKTDIMSGFQGGTEIETEAVREIQALWKQAAREVWGSFRSLRHEYINTMTAIDYLLKKERWEEAGQRAAAGLEMGKQQLAKRGLTFPEIYLERKQQEAESRGLYLERKITLPGELPFSDDYLFGILSVVWEMVMESVVIGRLPSEEASRLFFDIDMKKGVFRLQVSYHSREGTLPDGTELLQKAEQSGGTAEISTQEDRTEIRVLLFSGDDV